LSVRDNGPGIAPADVDKIFDPFFTTKDVGAGMGLGLSICYRIVQESGGRISVKTEPGKFCEFTLEFPVRTNQATN
jgi:signal transduction histidine kinase